MDNIISLAQYEDVNTLGISNMREVESLNKALEAGHEITPTTGGGALRVESLEASLKVLTHQAKHCAFWQKVPKLPAYSTVEEYNQLSAVGGDTGAFLPEGTLPETEDSSYNRAVELVKFMGTTRSVTHPMTLVKSSIGDVIAQENANGILWILKNMENTLFRGDADMCFNGSATDSTHREGVEFNGLGKQIDSSNVIDMKGAAMTNGDFDYASQMIASNYGNPTDIFYSFGAHEAFVKTLHPNERQINPIQGGEGGIVVGTNVTGVNTPFGRVNCNPDVFLNSQKTAPTASSHSKAPEAPASVAAAIMDGDDGVWTDHGGTGTYSYAVSAVNRYGESPATAITADLVVETGSLGSTITVTNAGSITNAPEYLNIYKTVADGTIKHFIKRIPVASVSAAGITTFRETGLEVANTTTAYFGELSPQVLSVKQLAPLMKMDLATLAPSIRWMILAYLTFVLYAPKKWAKIINVGQ